MPLMGITPGNMGKLLHKQQGPWFTKELFAEDDGLEYYY